MILTGIVRLGRDAELRTLPDGTAVANLTVVFNYGKKGDDGNRPSQWIDASFFGKRAESLSPYLLKGSQIGITLEQPHIETFQKGDGTSGAKLVARVMDIDLVSGQQSNGQQTQAAQPRPAPTRQPAPRTQVHTPAPAKDNFDDYDDSIPF